MAEREGFEPSIRFWRILTFQASAFDHSATAPHAGVWRLGAGARFGKVIARASSAWQPRAMFSLVLAVAFQAAPVVPVPAPPLVAKPYDALPADWVTIPDDEILVFTLGNGRRVAVRLAARYAPAHVANIRRFAAARWWDGETVYRVQDDYVVQWGDATEKKPVAPGVVEQPPAEYWWPGYDAVASLSKPDPYAGSAGYSRDGWPLATNGRQAWIPHCYAMVGVARDVAPSTGSGS